MIEMIGYTLVTIGVIFDFFGALALLRFPDVYNRLLGSTKCVTAGTSCIMLGIFVMNGFSAVGVKALLCMGFLLITSPVSAHVLSRAAHLSGIKPWEGSVCDAYEKDKEKLRNKE